MGNIKQVENYSKMIQLNPQKILLMAFNVNRLSILLEW